MAAVERNGKDLKIRLWLIGSGLILTGLFAGFALASTMGGDRVRLERLEADVTKNVDRIEANSKIKIDIAAEMERRDKDINCQLNAINVQLATITSELRTLRHSARSDGG